MPFNAENLNLARRAPRRVFCTETGALSQGFAVCYTRDYGTATSVDESRDTRVALPSATNQFAFAGVLASSYPANANGQWVEIYEPGGIAEVYFNKITTYSPNITAGQFGVFQVNDTGSLTTAGDPGKFLNTAPNGLGCGSCQFLQTVTASGLVPAYLHAGSQVGGAEVFVSIASSVLSVGGISIVSPAASATNTLAAGTIVGQRKRITCPTSSASVVLTVTPSPGVKKYDNTAQTNVLTAVAATAGQTCVLEWNGVNWQYISGSAVFTFT